MQVATAFSAKNRANNMAHTRRTAFQSAAAIAASLMFVPQSVHAFSTTASGDSLSQQPPIPQPQATDANDAPTVAYRPLALDIPEYGVSVPVAMWFPTDGLEQTLDTNSSLKYNHRISVKKIGQLLAGWNFIPEFASKDFQLQPTTGTMADGTKLTTPTSGPVVFLAHGYLGSR